ncbi:MAG: hypothetical protein AB2A00_03015 [Myxococcota bacterium]
MAWDLEPKGEHLRKALQWLSDRRREEPTAPLARLLDEAGMQFDLTPAEQEYLYRSLKQGDAPG